MLVTLTLSPDLRALRGPLWPELGGSPPFRCQDRRRLGPFEEPRRAIRPWATAILAKSARQIKIKRFVAMQVKPPGRIGRHRGLPPRPAPPEDAGRTNTNTNQERCRCGDSVASTSARRGRATYALAMSQNPAPKVSQLLEC